MSEVVLEYPVRTRLGAELTVRVYAAEAGDGTRRWHGWIEFVPRGENWALRTPPETTQPNRTCVVYWAAGLTPVYLEGAYRRGLARGPIRWHAATSQVRWSGTDPATTAHREPELQFTTDDQRFLRSLGIAAPNAHGRWA